MTPDTDLSLYDNDWYKKEIGASLLKQLLWFVVNGLFFINPFNPFSGLKCGLLRWFGAKVGHGVNIKPGVNIKYPWKLTIESNTWIGEKVWIENHAEIIIGKNVCISQGVVLLTGNHNYKKRAFDLIVKGIKIEDGVWLGATSVVCPGVTVAPCTVLTVGSVLTKNTFPFAIYSGNPAVFIRKRNFEAE